MRDSRCGSTGFAKQSRTFAGLGRPLLSCLGLMGIAALLPLSALAASLVVKTVPRSPSDPTVPHETFANRTITLQGTSSLQGSNIQATWDFGDGSAPVVSIVTNQYDVSATHIYSGSAADTFTAKLTVTDLATGESGSANYFIVMRNRDLSAESSVAIDEGLWYLHKTMNRSAGDWQGSCGACDAGGSVAINAANVLAFQVNGHSESGDPNDPYTETLARARRTLSSQLAADPGAPDTNALDIATVGDQLRQLDKAIAASGMPTVDGYAAELLQVVTPDGLAQLLVSRQAPGGFWTGHTSLEANGPFETAASIIMLQRRSPAADSVAASADSRSAISPAVAAVTIVTNVSAHVSVTQTGFGRNRATGIWSATMTVTNTSGSPIAGPMNVALTHLTPGVTMTNSNGSFNGDPYITLPGVTTLNPGQSVSVLIQFTNPSNGFINFTPVTYSGPFPPAPLNLTCPSNSARIGVSYNSALVATGGVQPYQYSISAGSLPPPLMLNSGTGAITGAPSTAGPYPFTGKVVDQTGVASGTTTASCNILVGSPPAFTSANTANFLVGQMGTFSITTSGAPVPAITSMGSLGTTGLTFTDNGNGTATLSGMPAANSGGIYTLGLTGSNGIAPNATQTLTVNVNQAPAITSANSTTFTVGSMGSFTVTTTGFPKPSIARGGVALPNGVTFVDNGNGTGTLSGTPGPGTANTYAITFAATNTVSSTAPQSFTLTVSKGSQTITFTSTAPAGAKVGGPTYNVTATATSGLTVAFTIDASATSVCSISGSTVSFTGAGTCVIDANQSGNVDYNAAPQMQQSFAVGKNDQTITFTSTAPPAAKVAGPTYNVTATATSGLTVAFTIDASALSVCSISGSTVSFIGAGTCVIDGNQGGNGNYNAAPQVQQSFAVAKGDQTVSFTSTAPVGAKVGGPTYTVTATATSGLTVAFTIDATAASVCSITGSTVSFTGVGTCVIDGNQAGNTNYNAAPQVQQSFAVAKNDQTITFTSTAPVGAKVGGPTYTVTGTATSGLTVAFTIDATAASVCSITGSTVSFTGVGTCVIDGNQAGNTNYNAAPQVQQSFAVAKNDQTITFTSTAPAGAKVGGPTYTVTGTATSGLPVAFTIDASATSVCSISGSTVSFTGAGTCVIDGNQAGNGNYNAAPQVQQSFAVAKGNQTVSFTSTAPAGAKVGGPTYTVTGTATSGLTVAFTVDASASSVCSISGSTVSFIGVGTCVIDGNQAGNGNYNAAPQVQQSFAVAKGDQTVSFTSTAPVGAKVGGPTYNVTATATSGLTVTLTIDATAASVCSISGSTVSFIGVGTCVIDGNQGGNANYNAAPQMQQSFAVAKGDQTISFTSTAPSMALVGGATYHVTATATSGLTVAFTIDASASSVCSISGSTVSFIAVGTCVIDANQAGNANYNAAPQVHQSFLVSQAGGANFACPAQDQLGFSLGPGSNVNSGGNLFCSYPAVSGEDPNDFFCAYSFSDGHLVIDNDAGLCTPAAVNTTP